MTILRMLWFLVAGKLWTGRTRWHGTFTFSPAAERKERLQMPQMPQM